MVEDKGEGPAQEIWTLEKLEGLYRVQMDWAQNYGKFKEAHSGSDLP